MVKKFSVLVVFALLISTNVSAMGWWNPNVLGDVTVISPLIDSMFLNVQTLNGSGNSLVVIDENGTFMRLDNSSINSLNVTGALYVGGVVTFGNLSNHGQSVVMADENGTLFLGNASDLNISIDPNLIQHNQLAGKNGTGPDYFHLNSTEYTFLGQLFQQNVTDNKYVLVDGSRQMTGNWDAGNVDFAFNTTTLYINSSTSYVGIGTNTPVEKLHVSGGDVRIDNGNGGGWIKTFDDHHGIYIRENNSNHISYYEYGDTIANGGGHVFRTGGFYPNQPLKLQIATDGIIINDSTSIGVNATYTNFFVNGSIGLATAIPNSVPRPAVGTTRIRGEISAIGYGNPPWLAGDDGLLRLSAGGGTSANTKSFIDITGYSTNSDADKVIVMGTAGAERMRIQSDGTVRIKKGIITELGTDPSGAIHLSMTNNGTNRFNIGLGGAEGGSNTGADFSIWRYNDSGNYLERAFQISRDDGNVSITQGLIVGSSSDPSEKLHVRNGNLRVDGSDNLGGWIKSTDDNHGIYFKEGNNNRINYYEYGDTIVNGGGHVFRTGGFYPNQPLKLQIATDGLVVNDTLTINGRNIIQSDTSNDLRLRSQSNTIYNIGDYHVWLAKNQTTEYMRITNNGNVGIGASTVLNQVHIQDSAVSGADYGFAEDVMLVERNGDSSINIIGASTKSSNVGFSDDDRIRGLISYQFSDDSMRFSASGGEDMRIDTSGALKLVGNPSPTTDTSSTWIWNQAGVGPTIAGYQFKVQTGSPTPSDSFTITNAGGVFAHKLKGTTGGSDVRYDTAGKELFYDTSSRRYKENIRDEANTSFIYDIPVVTYDRIDGSRYDEIGIIAEDLARIKPDMVAYNENDTVETYSKSDFVPLLINEIQKLNDRITELESKCV